MQGSGQDDYQEALYKELLAISQNDPHFIGGLQVVEIAFTKIPSILTINCVSNLVELTLLHTSLSTLEGIESAGHSL